MTHISILQSEDKPSSPQIPPHSLLVLRKASTSSESPAQALKQFIADKGHQDLGNLREPLAAEAADLLDELIRKKLDESASLRRRTTRALQTLCGSSGVFPESYTLQGEVKLTGKMPWTHGGFGEIWCGTWNCKKVAVKVIKMTGADGPEKLKKRFAKEVIAWGQLKHRHLLPLYGISANLRITDDGYPHPCLVSPWLENGTICQFARKNPTFNRFNLLVDVCQGLIYLHSEHIVHGDLKGDNVLVDDEGRAILADFGFTAVRNSLGLPMTSSSVEVGGTVVFMAPELLETEGPSTTRILKKPADIYALGMLIYEVLSGERPFHGRNNGVIKNQTINGNRPRRPLWSPIPDPVWDMVELCGRKEPAERPRLDDILSSLTAAGMDPPAEWPSPPSVTSSPDSTEYSSWNQPVPHLASCERETVESRPSPTRSDRGSTVP